MAFRWPWSRPNQYPLVVDFDREPTLPQGTASVVRHIPVTRGVVTLGTGDLILKRMPVGLSYADYYREHGAGCCDGLVLDAIFQLLLDNRTNPDKVIRALFGDLWGQIFFLGSSFAARDGGAECVSFLNVRTVYTTHMPAILYSCFAGTLVRPDVPVFACFLSSEKRPAA